VTTATLLVLFAVVELRVGEDEVEGATVEIDRFALAVDPSTDVLSATGREVLPDGGEVDAVV
jgi:hypothetical protein